MKETAPAFQLYIRDWRSSRAVIRMSFAERGMYIEMLMEQWESLSLPDSPKDVCELIGGTIEEWDAAWPALRRKFVALANEPGRIVNLKLEDIRKKRRKFVKRARSGGEARAASATRIQGRFVPTTQPAEDQQLPAITPATTSAESPAVNQLNTSTASATPTATATASPSERQYTHPRARHDEPLVRTAKSLANIWFPSSIGLNVPNFLHNDEFRPRVMNQRGIDEKAADKILLNWYSSTEDRYRGKAIGEDPLKFWRARFAEWLGTTTANSDGLHDRAKDAFLELTGRSEPEK